MTPLEHTFIATGLLAVAYWIGYKIGFKQGVDVTVSMLEEAGVIEIEEE